MASQRSIQWPRLDVFRPAPADVLQTMRSDTLQRLQYLTSRLRATLTVCMDRPPENRNALYDMMSLELVILPFIAFGNC